MKQYNNETSYLKLTHPLIFS